MTMPLLTCKDCRETAYTAASEPEDLEKLPCPYCGSYGQEQIYADDDFFPGHPGYFIGPVVDELIAWTLLSVIFGLLLAIIIIQIVKL